MRSQKETSRQELIGDLQSFGRGELSSVLPSRRGGSVPCEVAKLSHRVLFLDDGLQNLLVLSGSVRHYFGD